MIKFYFAKNIFTFKNHGRKSNNISDIQYSKLIWQVKMKQSHVPLIEFWLPLFIPHLFSCLFHCCLFIHDLCVLLESLVKFTKHHEVRIHGFNHLKCNSKFEFLLWKSYKKYKRVQSSKSTGQTFLNCCRAHKIFPKHLMKHGSCEHCMIVGSTRFISIGNKYHFSWMMVSLISSVTSLNL